MSSYSHNSEHMSVCLAHINQSLTWKGDGKLLSSTAAASRTARMKRSRLAIAILATGFTRVLRACNASSLRLLWNQVAAGAVVAL